MKKESEILKKQQSTDFNICNETIRGKVSKTITEQLREIRIELGVSQREISEKLGLSTSAYGCYEQGKTTPDAVMLQFCI